MKATQRWQCHKIVEAFKVADAQATQADQWELRGENGQVETVDSEWISKRLPRSHAHVSGFIGGYFVRYPDGYTSWSPGPSFEEGYTELKNDSIS